MYFSEFLKEINNNMKSNISNHLTDETINSLYKTLKEEESWAFAKCEKMYPNDKKEQVLYYLFTF